MQPTPDTIIVDASAIPHMGTVKSLRDQFAAIDALAESHGMEAAFAAARSVTERAARGEEAGIRRGDQASIERGDMIREVLKKWSARYMPVAVAA